MDSEMDARKYANCNKYDTSYLQQARIIPVPFQFPTSTKITNSKQNHAMADLRHYRVSVKQIHLRLLRIHTKTTHMFFLQRFTLITLISHQVIENNDVR